MIPASGIRRQAVLFLLLAAFLASLAGYALERLVFFDRPAISNVALGGGWITTPGALDYQGCFRKTVFLNSYPKQAWLRISGQESFEVIVNGKSVGHQFLWRATRQFQNGLSESGQRVVKSLPLLSLNFPREYQWGSHHVWEVPVFMDITPFLRAGDNSICVSVETRKLPARFNLSGEIATFGGETLPIASDATWKADSKASYSGGSLDWTQPHFDDQSWAPAVEAAPPSGGFVRVLDPAIYTRPFSALRLRAPMALKQDVSFETDWDLMAAPKDGWLRILSNRPYDLFVNGTRVNAEHRGSIALDAGDWIIGTQKPTNAQTPAELLDPEQPGSMDEDNRFLSPPHTDPTLADLHHFQDIYGQEEYSMDHPGEARDRTPAMKAAGADAKLEEKANSRSRVLGFYAPESRIPAPLKVDRRMEQFDAYSIASLLTKGTNHIRVRLLPAPDAMPLAWAPAVALDAGVTLPDHTTAFAQTGPGWKAVYSKENGETPVTETALPGGPARAIGISLPALQYHGFVYSQEKKMTCLAGCFAASLLLMLGWVGYTFRAHLPALKALLRGGSVPDAEAARIRLLLARGIEAVLLPATLLGAACLVQAAWGEREEILWFWPGATWGILLLAALALFGICISRPFVDHGQEPAPATSFMARFPDSLAWKAIVVGLLLFYFFLAAFQLDFQPIDDDEYASVQASLAIAKTGVPKYSEDVWYTRSPLYHYTDGASIAIFGENLWAMRMPGILLGVATAWLTYYCGRKLLKSPWVALGALCLYCMHPFLIFSSHVARFYQMQQFFALLTAYCFCRGFVVGQSMRWRYATIGAFLCAVLSQELSAIIGIQLAVGYLLFAEKKPWRDEVRFMVVAACALVLIGTDLVTYQVRCLTHLEGTSPVLEPAIHPQFANPLNFLSIFVAYSRLHLAVSALFFMGLPFAWRTRNRNVAALYFLVFSGAIFANLLITGDALRYQYWLMPMWLLLGMYGPKALLDYLDEAHFRGEGISVASRHWVKVMPGAILFVAAVLSFSPWRIPGSYSTKLLGDSTGAFQFVHANIRPGDAVAATEPHPSAALMEAGRSDYDLAFPRLYDFVYLKHGRLLDRNSGAQSVGSLDGVQSMFAHHDRVWIVVNREKMRSNGQDIRWAYPGAQAETFLRQNCAIAYQSYLWTVFLWDVRRGDYSTFRTSLTQ